ncbi:MAG: 3-oxoacyl-(acyl-carrier-protein) reductase FabG [Syntrophorhabdus sp. PtaU1.Bin153]|nr:MAG: 3-oxoacyl-(acyl-carrier-protein) reductase FabG [Syntrophorhabdus sp. PtaU1.Bin153]
MPGTIKGRTALVTGAGTGIGRAIALAFADEGAGVAVADVDINAGKETIELVRQRGSKALFVECDVSKGKEVQALIEATVREFGSLDYACNNAGIHNKLPESLADLDEDLWDLIIEVNLKGVMLCMKHEVKQMLNQAGGVITNIASLAGLSCEPGSYAYTAAKHGVVGLTRGAAFEYAKVGIRINAICPAVVDTPMLAVAPEEVRQMLLAQHPIGRFGKPEEIAAAVMWLCNDLSAFVTGSSVVLDGGASAW